MWSVRDHQQGIWAELRARAQRCLWAGCVFVLHASGVAASEGGASFWLPGLKAPLAGFLPPPGVYFQDDFYFYDGKLKNSRSTLLGGNIVSGVKQDTKVNFSTAIWVTPYELIGGNLALSLSIPFGEPSIRAGAVLNGPILNRLLGRPLVLVARDSKLNFGDPVLSGILGWHSGNFHWTLSSSVSMPAGAYREGELSNVALNRWIGDFNGALTYLDPELGIEASATGGVTVNGENPATKYRTGTELHADVSLSKYLTKELSVGIIASHYQQVVDDSGQGASRIGPNRGRDTAIGGTIGYTFLLGHTPISTRIKVLKEIETENRFRGTVGFLQVSFPLWSPASRAATTTSIAQR